MNKTLQNQNEPHPNQWTQQTMAAIREYSAKMDIKRSNLKMSGIVSTEMARAFTISDTLTRSIMPLCSAVPNRKYQDVAVTNIVDISGMVLRRILVSWLGSTLLIYLIMFLYGWPHTCVRLHSLSTKI